MSLPLHVTVHAPSVQRGEPSPLELQTRPHAPQFDVSFFKSTHEPEQFCRSGGQAASGWQRPDAHTSMAAHALPQAPQF